MKLSFDLSYILKRVIVIVLAFVIISSIKSCDVFAASFQITPSNCYLYYNSGTTNRTGTVSSVTDPGNVPLSSCVAGQSGTYYSTRFDIVLNQNLSGTGTISFYVKDYQQLTIVRIMTGGTTYTCDLNSGINYEPSNSTQLYSVTCANVPISNGRSYQIFIDRSNPASTGVNGAAVSRHFVYSLNDSSIITNSIDIQNQQQHIDSQDTQNAINNVDSSLNDSSISSDTQNANGLFDTDDNGQITNSNFQNFGIEGVITAPLAILQRATEHCSPVSFTIFSKSITLPCGDSLFWNRDFSSQSSIFSSGVSGSGLNNTRNTFRDFWNLFFGGAIIFHLLLKLYDVIQKAVDPVADEWHTLSSAIDTGSVVRDTDGDNEPLPVPKVHTSALNATNVSSYLMTKGV